MNAWLVCGRADLIALVKSGVCGVVKKNPMPRWLIWGDRAIWCCLLDIYEIFDNSNNIFSYGYDGVIITTVTVSSDGNLLTYNSYDDGICNKTNLTEPCN